MQKGLLGLPQSRASLAPVGSRYPGLQVSPGPLVHGVGARRGYRRLLWELVQTATVNDISTNSAAPTTLFTIPRIDCDGTTWYIFEGRAYAVWTDNPGYALIELWRNGTAYKRVWEHYISGSGDRHHVFFQEWLLLPAGATDLVLNAWSSISANNDVETGLGGISLHVWQGPPVVY